MSIASRQAEAYEALISNPEGPFIEQRPALFSPASSAQDPSNFKASFGSFGPLFLPLEFSGGWVAESSAHHTRCYLGDWTSLAKIRVAGPEAHAFLSWLGMNNLSDFADGQIKHHVQLDANGYVASEGVICRLGEEEFLYTAGSGDWLLWQFSQGTWKAQATEISPERFIFGVQGPTSIHAVESAANHSVRDIAFNHSRGAEIAGHAVRILRTGISGELGYEIHGDADAAPAVWSALLAAGAPHGIEQLGIRSQPVQHIEAGIATNGLDYMPAAAITPGASRQFRRGRITGSFVPTQFSDYFRRPDELGWGNRARTPSHDFLGRDALLEARTSDQRQLVGLRWNHEDVLAVPGSLFGDGDPIDQMEFPRRQGPAFDQVSVADESVGVSSGRTISVTLKATISLCAIDPDLAAAGTQVTVLWGAPGTRQSEIRATVTALPFLPDNRRVDVTAL